MAPAPSPIWGRREPFAGLWKGSLCSLLRLAAPRGMKHQCLKPSTPFGRDRASPKTQKLSHFCRCQYSSDSHDITCSLCSLPPLNHPWLSHAHWHTWLRGLAGGPAPLPHAQPVRAGQPRWLGSTCRTLAREQGLASRKCGQACEQASENLHNPGCLEMVCRGIR